MTRENWRDVLFAHHGTTEHASTSQIERRALLSFYQPLSGLEQLTAREYSSKSATGRMVLTARGGTKAVTFIGLCSLNSLSLYL